MPELNYSPHAVARQLATKRTHAVGLLITRKYMTTFSRLWINGILFRDHRKQLHLLVAVSQPEMRDKRSPPRSGPQ